MLNVRNCCINFIMINSILYNYQANNLRGIKLRLIQVILKTYFGWCLKPQDDCYYNFPMKILFQPIFLNRRTYYNFLNFNITFLILELTRLNVSMTFQIPVWYQDNLCCNYVQYFVDSRGYFWGKNIHTSSNSVTLVNETDKFRNGRI